MYKLLYTTSGSLIQFEDLILDFISSSAVHLALRKQKPYAGYEEHILCGSHESTKRLLRLRAR